MQTVTAENVFARSWALLSQNWVIIVPGLVVAIIAGIITALLTPQTTYVGDNSTVTVTSMSFLQSFLVAVVGILAAIVTLSYTTGMAGAAWNTGKTALGDGSAAFSREGGHVFSALIFLVLIAFVGALLAPFTLGLSLLVLFFLFPYTMAAAVLGDFGGIDALRESYRIATQHLSTTFIIIVVAGVIGLCGGLVAGLLHGIPFIGPLVAEIITQAVLAYLTLVLVGVYLGYRNAAVTAPAAAAYVPPAPEPPAPPPVTDAPPPGPTEAP
jgi:hypothetical protein